MKKETIRSAAIEFGIIERGTERGLTTEERNATLDEFDRRGIEHDEYRKYRVEKCPPPRYHPKALDLDAHREELRTTRYGDFIEAEGPVIWNDEAGIGKTTNSGLASLQRDRPHMCSFSTHEKAWDYITDDPIQDETGPIRYFHLRGAQQPLHDCCMAEKASADEDPCCPIHGTQDEWDHMCPVYNLPEDSSLRQKFDLHAHIYSYSEAHRRYCDDDCPWLEQFVELENQDRVVGVHQHQTHPSLQNHDIIIDESPTTLIEKETYSAQAASLAASDLDSPFDEFVKDLPHAVAHGDLSRAPLPPKDYTTSDLIKLKIDYNELIEAGYNLDFLPNKPLNFDVILALLAEAGWNKEACREAIAGPDSLELCPLCDAPTFVDDSLYYCTSCPWDEARFSFSKPPEARDRARAIAYIETTEENSRLEQNRIVFERLPPVENLPSSPLILDATATPEKVAGLYGVAPDEVTVEGTDTFELNAKVVQVKNGQYHASTIRGKTAGYSPSEQTPSQERFQEVVDNIAANHDKVLFILQQRLIKSFEFPDSAEVRYYGNIRGLNYNDFDAVVCLGAPHPNLHGIRRQARLLAMDNPHLRVGGTEHSTRQENRDSADAPMPPIYRKLYYQDENRSGRAVPTKHYTGLVGSLFEESREKELVQAAHRVRPLLAEKQKAIYLITNVPTSLPVDLLVDLDELRGRPLWTALPVPEGAITHLLQPLYDVMNSDTDENSIAKMFLEQSDNRIVATKGQLHELVKDAGAEVEYGPVTTWVNDLEELGLLTEDGYEYRTGDRYIAEYTTFRIALLVLSSSTDLKVEEARKFSQMVESPDGTLDWLAYAEKAFLKDE